MPSIPMRPGESRRGSTPIQKVPYQEIKAGSKVLVAPPPKPKGEFKMKLKLPR